MTNHRGETAKNKTLIAISLPHFFFQFDCLSHRKNENNASERERKRWMDGWTFSHEYPPLSAISLAISSPSIAIDDA